MKGVLPIYSVNQSSILQKSFSVKKKKQVLARQLFLGGVHLCVGLKAGGVYGVLEFTRGCLCTPIDIAQEQDSENPCNCEVKTRLCSRMHRPSVARRKCLIGRQNV